LEAAYSTQYEALRRIRGSMYGEACTTGSENLSGWGKNALTALFRFIGIV